MGDLSNDIARYHNGDLTPAEMHALEKRAMTDPFLAEALEGAAHVSPQEMEADLETLSQALDQRIGGKEANVVNLWTWPSRIAAGLLLLALAGGVAYYVIDRDNQRQHLALQTTEEPKTAPAPAPEISAAQPDATDELLLQQKPVPPADATDKPARARAYEAPATLPPPNAEPSGGLAAAPTIEAVDPLSGYSSRESEKADEDAGKLFFADSVKLADAKNRVAREEVLSEKKKDVASKLESASAPAGAATRARKFSGDVASAKTAPQKVIEGKVTNEDGQGLPGVNVVIKGTNTGTVTDGDGRYTITAPENATLSFSFIGFTNIEANTTNTNAVDVTLATDVSELSEVVVVGYGIDRDDGLEPTVELASPAGGKKAFKQYLEKNLIYPQQAIEQKVEGRVTIQFTVESTGQLSDFKVVRGLGFGCDEELIRLVRSGPKWIPTKRDREPVAGEVRVRMKFTLPDKK